MKLARLLDSELTQWALITHAVPAHRVRRFLPEGVELETTFSMDGTELGLISVNTYSQHSSSWPRAEHALFKTYIRYRGRPATWLFHSFVGSELTYWLQKPVQEGLEEAHFHIRSEANSDHLTIYGLSMQSMTNSMIFKLQAKERNFSEFNRYLCGRWHHLGNSPVGILFDRIYSMCLQNPEECELKDGYFGFWHKKGLLAEDEVNKHLVSALTESSVLLKSRGVYPALILPRPVFNGQRLPSDFSFIFRLGV